jgi:hypothetical protein
MEEIERLDDDTEVRTFLNRIRRSEFVDQHSDGELRMLADELDLTFAKLSSYIWLQNYISELINSCDPIPEVTVVAQQFGINLDVFQKYIYRRSARLEDELWGARELEAEEALEIEAKEAARLGMNVFEYREYLADLCEDASLQGD